MLSVKKLLQLKHQVGVFSVRPDEMVIDALNVMADRNVGAVVVMDGDELVGIFSERDYARKGIRQGRKAKSTPISEVMTPRVFTVSSDMNINDCMRIFTEKRFRHLPVVDDNRVVGVLSIGDIVSAIMQEQLNHIQYLEQYIAGS
ncbi:CBS domain-containing protein [Larkinella punicea]|uniref:CBS domain-containing protein n=1 Tax=Larkinella punicea TaxID=2315727 RepID=A0A368JSZ4_9BACT|nr:CBS domain-containing protein [Larkinella punicea]RCR70789.1 CBS domain-containing protein [Larkinella punicea]